MLVVQMLAVAPLLLTELMVELFLIPQQLLLPERMEMAMDLRIPDMTMTMDLDGTYRSTGSAPVTEPPAGAQVVDLMDSFTGGYYQTEQI